MRIINKKCAKEINKILLINWGILIKRFPYFISFYSPINNHLIKFFNYNII
jgi:hypothetical protein